jgi:hypothetical protein
VVSPLVELPLEAGGSILVEVDEVPFGGPVTRGGRSPAEAVTKAGETFEQVLGGLGPMLRGIFAHVRDAAAAPVEMEVEFAVKLSADANLIVARSGGEANFRVTVKWARDPPAT